MINAPSLLQSTDSCVGIQGTGVAKMNFNAHRQPAMDLMLKLGVGTAEFAWMADDAQPVTNAGRHLQFASVMRMRTKQSGQVVLNSFNKLDLNAGKCFLQFVVSLRAVVLDVKAFEFWRLTENDQIVWIVCRIHLGVGNVQILQ